ncbi:MAG: aldehyde dehydrogenase [Acidimicrobiales bacterium]|nr:aldehyde dehydrogenase [Acidimicrobiales bacterium]
MLNYDTFFIGGKWVDAAGTDTVDVVSPTTGEVIGSVRDATPADMDAAVAAARAAFDNGPWPQMSPNERADIMATISAEITAQFDDFATLISTEMGAPLSFAQMGHVFAATAVLDTYTQLARDFAFEEVRAGMLGPTVVRREPVGVAAAIIPWNVPLFITMLKLAPALASGSTMVVKPAPETPLDAFKLAEILERSGLPAGVVNIVPAGRTTGEHLVRHSDVDKVSFTGSTAAGRKIGAICGEQLKRCTLELGGKSAAIVCDDVDLDAALPQLLPAALMNNGEACVAQTRILAPRGRYDEVRDALADALRNFTVGDPLDPATECGPLVAERQRERVEGYIAKGKAEGATLVVGGGRPAGFDRGFFVEPTLFADVDNSMTIAREEIFGPVLSLIPYDGDDDAIAIANDSDYGLSGSVWTADNGRGLDIARRVRTGTYQVNQLAMDFGAPFGGFKTSGIGRELGPEGLQEYLEDKSIALPFGAEDVLPS